MKLRLLLVWFVIIILFITQIAQAQNLSIQTGLIDNNTPFIEFPVQVTTSGTTLTLDMRATTGNLDTLLYLVDAGGNIISENDDRVRGDTNSRITFPQAERGNYTVIATRFGVASGTSIGDFELLIDLQTGQTEATTAFRVSPDDIRATGFADVEVRPQAEWTIIAYYGGDNNLEPGLQFDFNEFELAGGSNQNVRVIMLFDRSPEHSNANGDWNGVRVYEIGFDINGDQLIAFPPTIDSQPLLDLGNLDTSNGELYAQYLVWALTHFPARNYAFSLASHGAGWKGIVTDDTARAETGTIESIMTLPELTQAFEIAKQTAGVEKFSMMINDACSMASVEYFAALAPHFNYSLASPEIVIDPALDMTLFTARLNGEGANLDLPRLGTDLVRKYVTLDMRLAGDADAAYFTHSLFDLQQYDPVIASIEAFASLVNENPSAYATLLGQARANTYTYTAFAGSTTKIDLGSLMREILKLSRDPRLINAANAVLEALARALIFGDAGENVLNKISYYNIYFPATSSSFQNSYFSEAITTEWGRMLRNFYSTVTPKVWSGAGTVSFHPPIAPNIEFTSQYPLVNDPMSILTSAVFGYELTGRNISHVDVTYDRVLPDTTIVRYSTERLLTNVFDENGNPDRVNQWLNGVNSQRSFRWDVALPVLSDGTNFANEYIIEVDELAFMEGEYYDCNTPETRNPVSIIFTIPQDNEPGRVARVLSKTQGDNSLASISLPDNICFSPYRSVVTGDGRVVQEAGNRYFLPFGQVGLTYTYQPAPTGNYNIGVLVTAFGGTTGFENLNVTVNNDGLFPELRAELSDLGVLFTRPRQWTLIDVFAGVLPLPFYRSSSQDGNSNISIYISPTAGTNLQAMPPEVMAGYYGLTWDGVFTDAMVDGLPVIEFAFSYEDPIGGRGTVDVRAIAFSIDYWAQAGFGFVITSEAVRGMGDVNLIYDQLKAYLNFFSPTIIADQDTGIWSDSELTPRVFFTEEVSHPMLRLWGESPDGIWKRYAIETGEVDAEGTYLADMTSPTFAAFTKIEAPASVDAVLEDLLAQYALGDGFTRVSARTLNTSSLSWQAVLYVVNRNGVAISGRIYVTIPVEGGPAYAAWVEAPSDADYANILEWMIDGFVVTEIVPES